MDFLNKTINTMETALKNAPDLQNIKDPTILADELEKLSKLQEQGLLTHEEFLAQKTKLLSQ